MPEHRTSIIPSAPTYHGVKGQLDYRAICAFAAIGFFLCSDTYWTELKALPVASDCKFDDSGDLISAKPYFSWHYEPRDITLDQAVEEFTELFEGIVEDQTAGRRVILPLSGGLDSRTLAAALKRAPSHVTACSYRFEGGLDETEYSRKIAETQEFPFFGWTVEPGYLWDVIDDLAPINGCFSEFTHPRQMAFSEKYRSLGDIFSLGHWGDVLFNDMGIEDGLTMDKQAEVLLRKLVKKGGMELGAALWQVWGINGDFREYMAERIEGLLAAIAIPDSANARIRAFKSMNWAPRWTSVNLSIFESVRPIGVPYYDNRMCEFICTVPERFLAGRKIQIEYLKRRAPALARIAWQEHRPFNLFNYQWDNAPWNLPSRALNKLERVIKRKKYVQRNWELQFLGEQNDMQLRARLFDGPHNRLIPKQLILDFYQRFTQIDPIYYSHSVSMLLTLGLFSEIHSAEDYIGTERAAHCTSVTARGTQPSLGSWTV